MLGEGFAPQPFGSPSITVLRASLRARPFVRLENYCPGTTVESRYLR